MSSFWQKIRELNGSQNDSFEELSCQLAHSESVPPGSNFTRKGKPDSGLECFWTLPDKSEWGWQAKFFPTGLNKSRWQQCDESVHRAIEGHPNLTKLYFCLPTAFADDRKKGRKSAQLEWEERRAKWLTWSKGKLEIILWDEHRLLERLSLPEHRGRSWFWFDTPALDVEWFRRHAKSTIASTEAAERYSPSLHLDVPFQKSCSAFGRTSDFVEQLSQVGKRLNGACVSLVKFGLNEGITEESVLLEKRLKAAIVAANNLNVDCSEKLPIELLLQATSDVLDQVDVCRAAIWKIEERKLRELDGTSGRTGTHSYDFSPHTLSEIEGHLAYVFEFCNSLELKLANQRQMVLVADAGFGKTHLFCHTLSTRSARGEPTLLVLGERFTDAEPWTQIIQMLGLNCDRDRLLGALDAAGEAAGCRALLMVDALNEGVGVSYWKKHLASIASDLSHYRYIGLGISVRSAYERQRTLPLSGFVRVGCQGFGGQAHQAARHFFQKYGLDEPNIPLLVPEFDSPLFLKLTCEALKAAGRNTFPSELAGGTAFFDFLLSSVNTRLAGLLDYDEAEKRVQEAVLKLASKMAELESEYLPLTLAKNILQQIHPIAEYTKSLLHRLISEHILIRVPAPGGLEDECIRFTYQRLSDHLIVQSILSTTKPSKVANLFRKKGVFGRHLDSGGVTRRYGWFEALAVQLPERFGCELDDHIPRGLQDQATRDAFLSSLQWRTTSSMSPSTVSRIEKLIGSEYKSEALDAVLSITARPGNPLNADWLDRLLWSKEMADRDAFWTVYLHEKLRSETPVKRLIEWARIERDSCTFDGEVIRLSCVSLVWCLTASDRFVRDRATKALVSLLENRISLLRRLIDRFSATDDPYVIERLYCVAYGCAMRTAQPDELQTLAQLVYDKVFSSGTPPASILLRDHARGVVERALSLGMAVRCDRDLLIPPFKSGWPRTPPSLEELERRYEAANYNTKHSGFAQVYASVTADDFKHYIIGDVTKWSDRRREDHEGPPSKVLEKLRTALTADDRRVLDFFVDHWAGSKWKTELHDELSAKYEAYLRSHLPKCEWQRLQKIIPWIKNPRDERFARSFSTELFQRLLLQRVLQLGFTAKRFDAFDRTVSSKGRRPNKAERIGKKYQWIAYDELHARICDNFGLSEQPYEKVSDFDWRTGLWQHAYRDIDPSLLVNKTPHDGWSANQRNWWTPHNYDSWNSAKTKTDWLKSSHDLPEPKDFLLLNGGGEQWLTLNSYANWKRKEHVGFLSGDDRESQEIHYIFRSYLIRKEHLGAMMTWGRKQDWINDRLPSPQSGFHEHLHEHYWAPTFSNPLEEDWIDKLYPNNDLPHSFVETTSDYLCENSGYDCSLDESVSLRLPTRWLAQKMGLRIGGRHGAFVDAGGNTVIFDPSTKDPGHGALVVRRSSFAEFLEREGLTVIWTLLAEKNIYPPEQLRYWPGRLTILGIYGWSKGHIEGDYRTVFQDGHTRG